MLPLKFRLDFFAILLFHRVIYETVAIKLPEYIKLARPSALRSSHRDPLTYTSTVRPRVITKTKKKSTKYKKAINLPKKQNKKSKKVKHKPKAKINKKTKKTSFFKKRKIRENIYKDDKNQGDGEDFSEERVFSNSFFYRTHLQWNRLPFELKNIEEFSKFESKLKLHMWSFVPGHDNEEVM